MRLRLHSKVLLISLLMMVISPGFALTDLAQAPINFLLSTPVKPNIFFILDDSGSMQSSFLGDEVVIRQYQNTVGYRTSVCNKIYYNPEVNYPVPVSATGTEYPQQNFFAASYDGFRPGAVTVNLSDSFMAWRSASSRPPVPSNTAGIIYSPDCTSSGGGCTSNDNGLPNRPEPAYYFVYKGNKAERLGDGSAEDHCRDTRFDAGATGRNNWRKVIVSRSSGPGRSDETTNFANWFSYHRTRLLTMKTAVGRALSQLDANYRVGYSTISESGVSASSDNFLRIDDFSNEHRRNFYEKLYAARPMGGTPLRAALAKAGRIYAGRLLTGSNDPVQYSCQQNTTILSTDGYWGTQNESGSYGPKQIDGVTDVGNPDARLPRPMFDGGASRTSNTLADVAAWYFENDLRTPALGNCGASDKLCENNVPQVPGRRSGVHQHMVTHTLGLGADGTLRYREDYDTAGAGDFQEIVRGSKNWPDPITATGAERIDDLWHAAVNGGGRYFSARSPESLARALSTTLSTVRAASGAAAASATSSQEPTEGDNLLFSSRYRSVYWDGELEARRISLADGSLASQIEWSASVQLRQRVAAARDDRTIYIPSSTDIYGLKEFRWQLLSTNERQLFSGCDAPPARRWQQCMQLSDTSRTQTGGTNLVDYLRGQSQFEDKPENSVRLFRKREQVLGAPINAQPVFVGAPAFRYADLNYGEYRDRIATNRSATVYLAANDGMLHAFDAATGRERWAFIPSGVLPELWRVADNAFANNFRYLLDGTPVVGDICPTAPRESCTAEAWRTILVAGLGAAGREYYALDITQADQPKLLWRIGAETEPQLGYAVGKPIITKRRDGKWVVLITSGYNNVAPGTGIGVLFVLDATTGAVLKRIETDVGTSDNPAGLAHLNAWVDNLLDNTAERVYGGDLLGNLWRFDINDTVVGGGSSAVRLARLVRSGVIQPITTRPELSLVRIGNQSLPVVSVGTGRYLGISDGSDKSVQSIYTFRDSLNDSGLGDIRQRSSMVQKRLASSTDPGMRTISNEQVDWLVNDGWFVDLDVQSGSGERVVVDPEQQLGMLSVVSNMPDSNACRPRAESWSYTFNYMNGSYIPSASNTSVARRVTSASMISGARIVRVGNRVVNVLTDDTGTVSVITQSSSMGTTPRARRVAWRELDQ